MRVLDPEALPGRQGRRPPAHAADVPWTPLWVDSTQLLIPARRRGIDRRGQTRRCPESSPHDTVRFGPGNRQVLKSPARRDAGVRLRHRADSAQCRRCPPHCPTPRTSTTSRCRRRSGFGDDHWAAHAWRNENTLIVAENDRQSGEGGKCSAVIRPRSFGAAAPSSVPAAVTNTTSSPRASTSKCRLRPLIGPTAAARKTPRSTCTARPVQRRCS